MSGAKALRNAEGNRTSLLSTKQDRMEKKRGSLKKRPTIKFMKFLDRNESAHQRLSKEELEIAKQAASAHTVIAESGRMLGRRQDQRAIFDQEDFDLDQFSELHMASLTEKGIGTLRNDLASLQERSEEEAQQAILGSYSAFVNACEGVAEVDSKFQTLRVLITSTTSLTNELKRAIQPMNGRPVLESADLSCLTPSVDFSSESQNRLPSLIEELDVAIAERDFPIASKLLMESDKEFEVKMKKGEVSCELEIEDRRQKIVNLIENQLQDPTLGAHDKHGLLQALASVAGNVHSVNFLLNLHSIQIQQDFQKQSKPHRSGVSEHEGADYSGSVAQGTFHGIGLAIEDFRSVFDSAHSAQLSPLVAQWTEIETRKCAEMINTNALSAFGAVGGLPAVVDSVSIALVFAQALNNSHSVCLMPILKKELWPSIEGMVQKFFVTTAEEISVVVCEEMSVFWTTSSPWDRRADSSSPTGPSLDSAQLLIDRLRYLCSILRPLWSPVARSSLKSGIKGLINSFVEALIMDVKEKSADGMESNVLDRMCEWLMNAIADLVENLIPKELAPLERKVGVVFFKTDLEFFINNAASSLGLEQINDN